SAPGGAQYDKLPPDLRDGLVPAHEYSVLKAVSAPSGHHILVRNPWGANVPRGAKNVGSGFFWLPVARFAEVFTDLTLSGADITRGAAQTKTAPESSKIPRPLH